MKQKELEVAKEKEKVKEFEEQVKKHKEYEENRHKVLGAGVEELKSNLEFKDMKFKDEKMKFNPTLEAEGKELIRESQLVQSTAVALPAVNTSDLKQMVD